MATTKAPDLGDILGGCGCFQVTISLIVDLAQVISAWGMMFMAFGIYNPGWRCMENTTDALSENYITSTQDYEQPKSNISDWDVECNKKTCQNPLYNPESSTIVSEWDFTCDLAWIPSIIITVQMSGVLIGAYVCGQVGDNFGRKVSLYGSVGVFGIGEILAAFSTSWQMYLAFTFIIGFGCGGMLTVSFQYPLEFLPAWWRGIFTAFPVWNIGCVTFAAVIYILKDWKNIHIATAIASAIVFLTVFWTPESVRWLAVNGKCDKAKEVVASIARMNGKECPDTSIIDSIAAEEKLKGKGRKYTYLDLLRISSIRGFSLKFGFSWVSIAISYYALSFGVKSLAGDFYSNFFIFAVLEIPSMLSIAPLVNRIGRRKTAVLFFGASAASSLSVVVVVFVASSHIVDVCVLVLSSACRMTLIAAWFTICVFSGELFPTVVRSLHYGYLNGIARVGSMLSPYLIPSAPDQFFIPYLIMGILISTTCGLIWTMPETKDRALVDRTDEKDPDQNALQNMEESI